MTCFNKHVKKSVTFIWIGKLGFRRNRHFLANLIIEHGVVAADREYFVGEETCWIELSVIPGFYCGADRDFDESVG